MASKIIPATTRLRVGCKINLFLRINGIRSDGYHDISTLFAPLSSPYDEMIIRPMPSGGLRVRCSGPGIDAANNTLVRAYRAFSRATGWKPGLELELVKGIPLGAGLGGGSADAGALLRFLVQYCPTDSMDEVALCRLAETVGASVGADVPFFLQDKACLGQGIGEKLVPCGPEWQPLSQFFLVLLCPAIHVNTAWAYKAWDQAMQEGFALERAGGQNSPANSLATSPGLSVAEILCIKKIPEPLTDKAKPAKNHRSCFFWPFKLVNDFEPVVFTAHAELARLKACLFQEGAAAACMSGSGSALFGLFRKEDTARVAAQSLQRQDVLVYGPSRVHI